MEKGRRGGPKKKTTLKLFHNGGVGKTSPSPTEGKKAESGRLLESRYEGRGRGGGGGGKEMPEIGVSRFGSKKREGRLEKERKKGRPHYRVSRGGKRFVSGGGPGREKEKKGKA